MWNRNDFWYKGDVSAASIYYDNCSSTIIDDGMYWIRLSTAKINCSSMIIIIMNNIWAAVENKDPTHEADENGGAYKLQPFPCEPKRTSVARK